VITRRRITVAGGIGMLAPFALAWGQSVTRIRRVGILLAGSITATAEFIQAFKLGMRDLGWVEGQNVEYRIASADGNAERLDALAGDLVAQRFEVILMGNGIAALAAQRTTKTIPIVIANVPNPVENKLVASLARPGGNITGVTGQGVEVFGKLIEIFHEVVPGAKRLAIVINEAGQTHRAYWGAAQSTCAALKIVPLRVVANAPDQFEGAAARIVQEHAQAIVVVSDGYLTWRAKLVEIMRATRLPTAYSLREFVVAGGLLSYGADLRSNYLHAATYVDKILKGANPANLPVEQPTKFELVINMKTAKALGLTVPQALLARADEVIE